METAKLRHYLAGVEGLALLRHWLIGDRKLAVRRFDALRELVQDSGAREIELPAPELDVVDGYARWSATYDAAPNPLIAVEQPAVRAWIDALPRVGTALDAACGSGRHTAYLVERGWDVCGIDGSCDMLARARQRLPHTDLRQGDLCALPVESDRFDLVVCSLALTHCAQLVPPVRELARVTKRGGLVIVSDQHPFLGLLGNTALFLDERGSAAIVKSHAHLHADYVAAFAAAGLGVIRCEEPRYTEAHLPALLGPLPASLRDAIAAALLGLPGALLWELERR